jgi:transposase
MDGTALSGRKRRVFRRVEEKLRLVKLTLEPGASVASIALTNGVNANQVFRWKRQYERGELQPRRSKSGSALVPVTIDSRTGSAEAGGDSDASTCAATGRQRHDRVSRACTAEHRRRCRSCRDSRCAGEPGAVIELRSGTRIWLAAGTTDMRRGFHGLSAQVQTVLEQEPYSGHVFVFRGRRGDLIKLLWFDGDGLCLFQKRLERGRFIWPQATSGTVSLSRAQLSMLLEGIDWRRPDRTWQPPMAV